MHRQDYGIIAGFAAEHENDDTARLLLSRKKREDIDMDLAVNTILSRKKLKGKVPAWYSEPRLVYPAKLSAEQCSSEGTAMYKAFVAREAVCGSPDNRSNIAIADLTGGLGVDSWAFSQVADRVLYNEMNPALADAAEYNFRTLGVDNILVNNAMLSPGSVRGILKDFHPDLIFLDPARRAEDGKKVFLLEDCQPDVLGLKDELLSISRLLMVKLSPMADIGMVLDRLGSRCRELHVISSGGECKELLVLMDRDFDGECRIVACCGASLRTAEDRSSGIFSFRRSEEKAATAIYPSGESGITSASYLFEPGKALLKSGAFNLISERFRITKLSRNTHLYIFSDPARISVLSAYGKVFRILDVFPMNGKGIRQASGKYPEADVTARNTHMSSDMLRKKLGCRPGSNIHIFGAEFLFVTEKMEKFDKLQRFTFKSHFLNQH